VSGVFNQLKKLHRCDEYTGRENVQHRIEWMFADDKTGFEDTITYKQ